MWVIEYARDKLFRRPPHIKYASFIKQCIFSFNIFNWGLNFNRGSFYKLKCRIVLYSWQLTSRPKYLGFVFIYIVLIIRNDTKWPSTLSFVTFFIWNHHPTTPKLYVLFSFDSDFSKLRQKLLTTKVGMMVMELSQTLLITK